MKVRVRILWHVVVEDDVDSLYVHASAKQVGGHQDTSLEVFELLVPGQPEGEINDVIEQADRMSHSHENS